MSQTINTRIDMKERWGIFINTFKSKWKLERYGNVKDLYFTAYGNREMLDVGLEVISNITAKIKPESTDAILNKILDDLKQRYGEDVNVTVKTLDAYWKIPMSPYRRITVSLLRTEVPRHNEEQFVKVDAITSEPEVVISVSDYFMSHLIWVSRNLYRFYSKHNIYKERYLETHEWGKNPELESAIIIKTKEMLEFAKRIVSSMKCNAELIDGYYVIPKGVDIVR